ncbi:MAG: hypothetical protein LBN02_09580 [Oscillospiraceae bacterium]|jgi:hypothetical protein|nr:hypothetical protein [Oscillospiraceae bacterium]
MSDSNLDKDYAAALELLDAAERHDSVSSTAKDEKAEAFARAEAAFRALAGHKNADSLASQAAEEAADWREKAGINTKKKAQINELKRSGIGSTAYFVYNKMGRGKGIFRILAILVFIIVIALFVWSITGGAAPNR